MHSLERNRSTPNRIKLLPELNALDTSVYGTNDPSYQSFTRTAPKFASSPASSTAKQHFNYDNNRMYAMEDGGYTTSETNTNTYKIPGGYKTVTDKYESYHTANLPLSYTATERYSSAPLVKNGTDYHTAYSQSSEYANQPFEFKDADTLEQKMFKKTITQHVTEKKSTSMMHSSKQESSSRTFRLE